MIDLNDIALFVQVVRSGSFAEAARRLGIPANTVSRRIQQLEQQLGMRLLQRSTRKLTLTNSGQTFYERCADNVEGLNEAARDLMTDIQEPGGLIRVAAPADFFDFFLMDWTADFLAKYPKVLVEFILSDAKTDLIAERIDVAFRGGSMQDSGYIGRQTQCDGNQCLVASPAYIAAHGMPDSLQDLVNHACVSFSQPGSHAVWSLTGPNGMDEEVQFVARFSGNTVQALRKAAMAGIGIALLPNPIIKHDFNAGLLLPVLPQYKRTGRNLHVLYPSRRHLPLAVSIFIELVVEKLTAEYAA
ncbi:LysR substrate-binding domain-containing protein [Undibacterium sp. Di26W]|uniref:LysR family transcriptional regulator n=1 Tax=Undibacterium sp. Di26W TaxID=3413035 RepID=UPI003BF0E296